MHVFARGSRVLAGAAVVALVAACSGGSDGNTAQSPTTGAGPGGVPTAGPVVATPTTPTARLTATTIPPGAQLVTISALEDAFDPPLVRVHPGALHITLRNVDIETHNLIIPAGTDATTGDVTSDQSASVDVVLNTKGQYDFFCSYHRLTGMTGVIVVQ